MPRYIITLTGLTTLLAACSAPTGPSTPETMPGDIRASFAGGPTITPTNCRGQSTALAARIDEGVEGFEGFAGRARFFGITVQEGMALVQEECGL
jgi:hypothetical protein